MLLKPSFMCQRDYSKNMQFKHPPPLSLSLSLSLSHLHEYYVVKPVDAQPLPFTLALAFA